MIATCQHPNVHSRSDMALQIGRLAYALGAEISGVDLRETVDTHIFDAIRAAFLEHSVLVFRGQRLTRAQHVAFSRRFGELASYEDKPEKRAPDMSEVYM